MLGKPQSTKGNKKIKKIKNIIDHYEYKLRYLCEWEDATEYRLILEFIKNLKAIKENYKEK